MKRRADGEELAAALLEEIGYQICARNWHAGRSGELDLVAMDGDTLVIVEVKTARSNTFGDPVTWVDGQKQKQLGRLAELFLASEHPVFSAVRFDVICVDHRARPPRVTHLQDAFRPDPV